MNKQDFLNDLRKGLKGLPQEDIEERVSFYEEMIDDKIEDGLSEEQAVSEIGEIDEIVPQIIADTPLSKLVKEKIKPQKLKAWEIVLLVLGAPIWLSLLISAFAVVISLYASVWAVVLSLWAVFASLVACGFAFIVAGAGFCFGANAQALTGVAVIGAGLVCLGLSIFMFNLCKALTNGVLLLTKRVVIWIKNCFVKKEGA